MQEIDKNILYRFFLGECSVDEEKELLDWLDRSEENMKIFLSERELFDKITLNLDTGESETATLLSVTKKKEKRKSIFWIKELAKIAAALLIALVAVNLYQQQKYDALLSLSNEVVIPPGERVNMILSDGTQVCVNAKSTLKYPSLFGNKERRIILDGEAFFEVSSDDKVPFIVETSKGEVRVLGTKFNVEAYSDQNKISVALIEGKVEVSKLPTIDESFTLLPNQCLDYIDGQYAVYTMKNDSKIMWKNGLIVFEDTRFSDLMALYEKHFDVKIEIVNPQLLDVELTGKIRINDGIEHALKVIQRNVNFEYRVDSTPQQTMQYYIE